MKLVASLLIGLSSASIFFGSCPTTTNQASMDFTQYTGKWYEYTRDWTIPFEFFQSCVTANYASTFNDGSGGISVINRAYFWPFSFLAGNGLEGRAKCDNTAAGCDVSFSPTLATPSGDSINYNVLATDYTNYSVVYSCSSFFGGLMSLDMLWVLSREPQLS